MPLQIGCAGLPCLRQLDMSTLECAVFTHTIKKHGNRHGLVDVSVLGVESS
jgi:hypothetical protein